MAALGTSSVLQDDVPVAKPTLDVLVSHLLAARRSLSCVEQVSSANDMVTNTRKALETQTVLRARTQFIRRSCRSQADILDQLQSHASKVAQDSAAELGGVIKNLNAAEAGLRSTVDQLRATRVEPGLRPTAEEAPKSLADFVDETGVQALFGTVREALDAIKTTREGFESSIDALNGEANAAKDLLSSQHERTRGEDAQASAQASATSPIPELLQDLEEKARDMANNLESLVKHFDLCVTAVKHTEGGGAAASKLADDLPEGMDLDINKDDGQLEPMTEQERGDMLEVIEKDSVEVDEVVQEIRDKFADMEVEFDRVVGYGNFLYEDYERTLSAFRLLDQSDSRLPYYVTQTQIFMYRWGEEKARIEDHIAELGTLREFYASFILAYDNLLLEVGRRKDMERRMAKVRQEALSKLDKLVEEEIAERNLFKQEQGDFLPVDIWPGLMTNPARYDITIAEGASDSIPDISASVINKAIRRVSHRMKGSNA